MDYTKFREQLHEFKDKIYLFRISDFGERPHMQLGFGKIPFSKIMRNVKDFDSRIVIDTLLSVENELIFRNPKFAVEKSIEYLKTL
jgi:sugar phosphate isomerase/epimerase